MTFWIVTSLMALAVAALMVVTLLRARNGAEPAAAYDLQVYRDQLKDVDRDLARGTLAEADAERIRTEVSRRILAADAQSHDEKSGTAQPRPISLAMAAVLGVMIIGGSLALYRSLGAPGYGDLALDHRIEMAEERRETRPDQAAAETRMPVRPEPQIDESYKQLITQLRETVATRPDDIQGLELLARHESNLGNYTAAYTAKGRVIELKGDNAEAQDYAEHAEMLIAAAGGYVSPEAEQELRQVLAREPWHGAARYYWGLMLMQTGRPDLAFRVWDQTLRAGPPDAPWIAPIRGQIEDAAWRAGVEYELPPLQSAPLAGPSAEDMQAVQDMTDDERQEMIRGMVDRLSERLASEGGSPEEWARLIGALGVLGDTDRAAAIYDEALQVFAASPQALDAIRNAGRQAGLGE
ncbi:c-type cytochrome biogenesis protein CcmI [Falsiphaeobacter marinintestinus]|uniref:c-type cytochrome biogenesis protein CcmI n=1 Tax=Falsiphaeobacter marinintestinus TaxID=1492905 RepID=UPI0011B81F82|nr:c-type cytochrome biogenesis protein CcmI [Phaeobacter marinintestinus]